MKQLPAGERIAVTGLSMHNALGAHIDALWPRTLAMDTGVRSLRADALPERVRALMPPDFLAAPFVGGRNSYCDAIGLCDATVQRQEIHVPPQDFRVMSSSTRLTLRSAQQAVHNARLDHARYAPHRVGVFISQNAGECASTLWPLQSYVHAAHTARLAAQFSAQFAVQNGSQNGNQTGNPMGSPMSSPMANPMGSQGGGRICCWSKCAEDAFADTLRSQALQPDESSMLARLNCVAAGMICQHYGFAGPAFSVGAACASSIAALYAALPLLRDGTLDAAVVGGAEELFNPLYFIEFCALGALAHPQGAFTDASSLARPFDRHRTGFVLGEGAATVILERESTARARGAHIYGLITGAGSVTNSRSPVEPVAAFQQQAIEQSFAGLAYGPDEVDLIECHATATVQGDLEEGRALAHIYGRSNGGKGAVLSAYKAQIGHTTSAAGLMALIHGLLALRDKVYPGTANCSDPDPAIPLADEGLRLPPSPMVWEKPAHRPRRLQVNAFAFGGMCYAVHAEEDTPSTCRTARAVTESAKRTATAEATPAEATAEKTQPATMTAAAGLHATGAMGENVGTTGCTGGNTAANLGVAEGSTDCTELHAADGAVPTNFSANSTAAPAHIIAPDAPQAATLSGDFDGTQDVIDGVRCVNLIHQGRQWLLGSTSPNWMQSLAGLSAAPTSDQLTALERSGVWLTPAGKPPPVAVMCCGQGNIWPGMGRALYDTFPAARAAMDRVAAAADWDVLSLLDETELEKITLTRWQQPYLFLLEYAQASYLESLGFRPDVMSGHSLGELIALCLAGVYTPEQAWHIMEERAKQMAKLEAAAERDTCMMAVYADAQVVEQTLQQHPELLISNYNTPTQFILSGPTTVLQEARRALRKQKKPAVMLNVSMAFHHPGMRVMREESARRLAELPTHPARLPMLSCITAGLYPADKGSIVEYIVDLDENAVRWVQCVNTMWQSYGVRHFVEMGPADTLCGLTADIRPEAVCISASRKNNEIEGMRATIARLYALGHLPRPRFGSQPVAHYLAARPLGHNATDAALAADYDASHSANQGAAGTTTTAAPSTATPTGAKQASAQSADTPAGSNNPAAAAMPASATATAAAHDTTLSASPSAGQSASPATGVAAHHPKMMPPAQTPPHVEELMPVIMEATGFTREELGPDMDLRHDLSIRSSRFPLIMHGAEERFGITIGFEDIMGVATIRDLADVLVKLRDAQAAAAHAPAPNAAQKNAQGTAQAAAHSPEQTTPPPPLLRYCPEFAPLPLPTPCENLSPPARSAELAPPARSAELAPPARSAELAPPARSAELAAAPVILVGTGDAHDRWQKHLHALGATVQSFADAASALAHCRQTAIAPQGLVFACPEQAAAFTEAFAAVPAAELGSPAAIPAEPFTDPTAALTDSLALLQYVLQKDATAFCCACELTLRAPKADSCVASPLMAGLEGMLLALALEYPKAHIRAVCAHPAASDNWIRRVLQRTHLTHNVVLWHVREDGQAVSPRLRPRPADAAASPLPMRQDDVLVVCGGGRGITPAALEGIAPLGCTLLLLGRSPLTPEATVSRLTSLGAVVRYLPCDCTDADAVRDTFAEIQSTYGKVDGILHTAGINRDATLAEMPQEDMYAVIATKCTGLYNILQSAYPLGLRYAVAFSSLAGWLGNYGQSNYSAANRAMAALLEDFAAAHRLACRCIWLPPVLGAGMASGEDMRRQLAMRGLDNAWIESDELGNLLARECLAAGETHIVWGRVVPSLPTSLDAVAPGLGACRGLTERPALFGRTYPVELVQGVSLTMRAGRDFSHFADAELSPAPQVSGHKAHDCACRADATCSKTATHTADSLAQSPASQIFVSQGMILTSLAEAALMAQPWNTVLGMQDVRFGEPLPCPPGVTRQCNIELNATPQAVTSTPMGLLPVTLWRGHMVAPRLSANGRRLHENQDICAATVCLGHVPTAHGTHAGCGLTLSNMSCLGVGGAHPDGMGKISPEVDGIAQTPTAEAEIFYNQEMIAPLSKERYTYLQHWLCIVLAEADSRGYHGYLQGIDALWCLPPRAGNTRVELYASKDAKADAHCISAVILHEKGAVLAVLQGMRYSLSPQNND